MLRLSTLAALCAAAIGFAGFGAQAAYPEKDITIIVPFGAGGGTDTTMRTYKPFFEKYIGRTAVIVNKPGAGGSVGFSELALSKPDGYTLGFVNFPNSITAPIVNPRSIRYTTASFAYIATLVTSNVSLNVPKSTPFKTLKDFVDYAKSNPGVITIAISGIGGDDHLSQLSFMKKIGANVVFVPFQGGAPARTATIAGHVAAGSFSMSEAARFQDQLNTLGVMSEARKPFASDVPTFKEQGYDYVAGSNHAFAAPAGTPQAIVDKVAGALKQAFDDPEFKKAALKRAIPAEFRGPAETRALAEGLDKELRALWQTDPWLK